MRGIMLGRLAHDLFSKLIAFESKAAQVYGVHVRKGIFVVL